MAYCTTEQMTERFGNELLIQLTDRSDEGAVDPDVLEAAIADASAEIDMHLKARYQLPLAVIPLPLTRMACILARDILATDSDMADERWDAQVKQVRETLKGIAAGRISLGVDEDAASPQPSDLPQIESGGRVWGRKDNGGFL